MNSPQPPMIQTPLQQVLHDSTPEEAQALLRHHAERLKLLARHCRRQQDAGLAPPDYARMAQLLAACEAGLRVLQRLSPGAAAATGRAPPGPAHGWPLAAS